MKISFFRLGQIFLMLTAIVTGTAHADPDPSTGTGIFQCQIVMQFPSAVPSPTKTSCDGGAVGVATGLGKDRLYVANGAFPVTEQKKAGGQGRFTNFELYHVVASDICAAAEPFPSVGAGVGDAFINGISIPLGLPGAGLAGFAYTRTGAVVVALLSNVDGVNANFGQKTAPVPNGVGIGVAVGVIEPKSPIGSCAAPNPQQGFIVTGEGWATTI